MEPVLWLSRLQFAATCFFHFLFVPLTLGLSVLVAHMETRYVRTGDEDYLRMTKFWGRLFLINFVIGVVTGITLEFQLGTNWSRYSAFVGDIFGSLLAIEATVAFFLESTFLAVWAFGWKRLSPRFHAMCIWVVALASNLSAFWILCANAWMQHPVGYEIRVSEAFPQGRAEVAGLSGFFEIITQPTAFIMFAHTVLGAFLLSGFFVLGISAYHLRRRQHVAVFEKSFRLAATFTLIVAVLEVAAGHHSGTDVAQHQPLKLAAMEALWKSESHAPQTLFVLPDEKNERNLFEWVPVHPVLSILAHGEPSAEVQGLLDFPKEDRPPVTIVFLAFRIMVGLGFLFVLLAFLAWFWRKDPYRRPWFLRVLLYSVPLPYVAIQTGWIVTEVGRQPWIVYNMMRTSDAVSLIHTSQVAVSLAAFVVVYTILGIVDFCLLSKYARRGPGAPAPEAAEGEPRNA